MGILIFDWTSFERQSIFKYVYVNLSQATWIFQFIILRSSEETFGILQYFWSYGSCGNLGCETICFFPLDYKENKWIVVAYICITREWQLFQQCMYVTLF